MRIRRWTDDKFTLFTYFRDVQSVFQERLIYIPGVWLAKIVNHMLKIEFLFTPDMYAIFSLKLIGNVQQC